MIIFGLVFLTLYSTRSTKVEYSKYIPPKEFKITFECPDDWIWNVYNTQQSGLDLINTHNPVSQYPYDGLVSVQVSKHETQEKSETKMNDAIALNLASIKGSHSEILSDKTFEIGRHFARQIISKWGPYVGEGRLEPIIKESIYVLVGNSYYLVDLNIFESERYSEFGQGFNHMIETMNFIP